MMDPRTDMPYTGHGEADLHAHALAPGVSLHGSAERGMVVVAPGDPAVVAVLKLIDAELRKRSTKGKLYKMIHAGDTSVREIQAGRLEVFVQARFKGSTAFDAVTQCSRSLPRNTKEILLNYATSQARRDTRLAGGDGYKFGNFSLIISDAGVLGQARHVDLLWPNFQFGLLVSDEVSGTSFSQAERKIQGVDDLEQVWRRWTGATDALFEAMRANDQVGQLLRNFGDVLVMNATPLTKLPSMSSGSLLSLPGSVEHAGPATNKFRAVLFFSANPEGEAVADYDPDQQYTGPLLCGHLISLLWQQPLVADTERQFLLTAMAHYMEAQEGDVEQHLVAHHFAQGPFSECVETLQKMAGIRFQGRREKYVKKMASKHDLCPSCDPFQGADSFLDVLHVGRLKQVSVDGLVTNWEGAALPVIVYFRNDDSKVILNYPTDDQGQWEGHRETDSFTLRMSVDDTNGRFDGTNGKLLSSDGEEIKCWTDASPRLSPPSSVTSASSTLPAASLATAATVTKRGKRSSDHLGVEGEDTKKQATAGGS